jgi:hypothetical protein
MPRHSKVGRPDVVEAPTVGGEMVGRRLDGAWLVVASKGVDQRLRLLEHFRTTIRL